MILDLWDQKFIPQVWYSFCWGTAFFRTFRCRSFRPGIVLRKKKRRQNVITNWWERDGQSSKSSVCWLWGIVHCPISVGFFYHNPWTGNPILKYWGVRYTKVSNNMFFGWFLWETGLCLCMCSVIFNICIARYDMIRYDKIWYDMILWDKNMIWYHMIQDYMARYYVICCYMLFHDVIWCDMMWN